MAKTSSMPFLLTHGSPAVSYFNKLSNDVVTDESFFNRRLSTASSRTRSDRRHAKTSSSSHLPRRISTSIPVIIKNSTTLPWQIFLDSSKPYLRSYCSSNRLSKTFIWWWIIHSSRFLSARQAIYWHSWIISVISLPLVMWFLYHNSTLWQTLKIFPRTYTFTALS
jgi:hypothetical protein